MGRRKCCVTDCKSTSETHCVYRFPRDSELRKLWMSYLVPHNSSLLMLSENQLLSKTVCQLHFERRMFDALGVKMPYAYPCLFSKNEISNGVPLLTDPNKEEHNYCKKANEEDMHPTSSESCFILRPGESVEHLYQTMEIPPICLQEQESSNTVSQGFPSTCILTANNPQSTNDLQNLAQYSSSAQTSSKQKENVRVPKRKMSSKNRRLVSKILTVTKNSVGKNSATRIQQALNLSNSELINDFYKLKNHSKTFIMMQLKSIIISDKVVRRYTLEEKLLCLTIMKRSKKCYKLLQQMFSLPSQRTLSRLSEKIIFEAGINENIMSLIKEKTKNWSPEKKLCSIVFDEVSINTHLSYNEEKDIIYGFSDIAGRKKIQYCDHALVIMIRGVCLSWRQPLAYYFCEGTTSAVELKSILKEVVAKVSQSGLLPLALICDQGSTFRTAINQLRQETTRNRTMNDISDDGTLHISGHDLSVIYDPPHLIKGIRNNFLTKDMMFGSKIAKWSDIMIIYDIDNTLGHTRAIPKLTKQHVDKDSMRKMKVSIATQVLSARVAAMLRYTDAVVKRKDGGSLSPTMATTADVIEFFDNLFDSVNGRPGDGVKGKLFRAAVKPDSCHLSFWHEAKKKISEIKFIAKNGQTAYVPSIRGWITTLESFIRIAKLLFSKFEIKYFYPRFLNQDPLENFFGRLRANNYRNVIPDANAFIYTFKSLVLSNVLSPISKFGNCEEDEGDQLISLQSLFQSPKNNTQENKENISPNVVPSSSGSCQIIDLPPVIMEKIKVHCSAYTAGYISRKLNKNINCHGCQNTIQTKEISCIHKYIQYREYTTLKNSNLAYPSEKFLLQYRYCSQIVHNYLNQYCFMINIGKTLKKVFENQCDLEWMGCNRPNHKENIKQLFFKMIIRLQVHNWVKIINKILRGAIEAKYVKKWKLHKWKLY